MQPFLYITGSEEVNDIDSLDGGVPSGHRHHNGNGKLKLEGHSPRGESEGLRVSPVASAAATNHSSSVNNAPSRFTKGPDAKNKKHRKLNSRENVRVTAAFAKKLLIYASRLCTTQSRAIDDSSDEIGVDLKSSPGAAPPPPAPPPVAPPPPSAAASNSNQKGPPTPAMSSPSKGDPGGKSPLGSSSASAAASHSKSESRASKQGSSSSSSSRRRRRGGWAEYCNPFSGSLWQRREAL